MFPNFSDLQTNFTLDKRDQKFYIISIKTNEMGKKPGELSFFLKKKNLRTPSAVLIYSIGLYLLMKNNLMPY